MAETSGLNSQALKRRNRGLILRHICTGENVSRVGLSKLTGLTKMAVTNIVDDLMTEGYVAESWRNRSATVGRSPVQLTVSANAPLVLGITVMRGKCTAALFDIMLRPAARCDLPLEDETPESLMQKILSAVDCVLEGGVKPLACGVACPSPMEPETGLLLNPMDFYGIENLPLGPLLEDRLGIRVLMNNDVNAAALSERLYGFGRELDNFLYIGICKVIGSAIVADGHLYHRCGGYGSALGHTSIDRGGTLCACGRRGCLECYISTSAVEKRLNMLTGLRLNFEGYCRRSALPAVDDAFRDNAHRLAWAVLNEVNMLNPQAVILGHDSALIPSKYITMVEEEVNKFKFSGKDHKIPVLKARLGREAPVYGSACLVLERLFETGLTEPEAWLPTAKSL